MNNNVPVKCLNNGVVMPMIGLGTDKLGKDRRDLGSIIEMAYSIGYRHIDTAQGYHNEEAIGEALYDHEIPRDSLFITTKLEDSAHGYYRTLDAVERSLQKLQIDTIDLFLIHAPNSTTIRDIIKTDKSCSGKTWADLNAESWQAMEKAVADRKIRSIGVSNFRENHLGELLKTAHILPAVNQIRLCIGCIKAQENLIEYCVQRGIFVEAYSPLGKGNGTTLDEPAAIAAEKGFSSAQILLSYFLNQGIGVVVKSSSETHLKENLESFKISLTDRECNMIRNRVVDERWAKYLDPDTGMKIN